MSSFKKWKRGVKMIPKIIHYVWLGNTPMPMSQQEAISYCKKIMPDYSVFCWDNDSINQVDSVFVSEACSTGKWAFASDVIRLWALYNYGGIYLDTDVKVCKSFDSLLDNHAFIGREGCLQIQGKSTSYHLTSFCLGAEKGNEFIKHCLDYYTDRHFITSYNQTLPMKLRMDIRNASEIYCEMAKMFGYNASALAPSMQYCKNNVLTIFPPETFSSPQTNKSYCTHLSYGSWREGVKQEEHYTLKYKIGWRLRWIVERFLLRFNYVMIKLR